MGVLKINHDKIDVEAAEKLKAVCPFGAITYQGGRLEINAGCKMCRLCVKKGPAGAIEYVEEKTREIDKSLWRGIAVYADHDHGVIHKVTLELLGKARELADKIKHPVYALLIGSDLERLSEKLLSYGADRVYVYDHPELSNFNIEIYADVFEDFINKVKPSSVLVGATNLGRSLAPRVAARFRTGLTADCTRLEIKENTDLVQIRPAFGGNIMARIVSPDTRPQFCTVRYKVFSSPEKTCPHGQALRMKIEERWLKSRIKIRDIVEKPKEEDISEADVIVAVGRGVKPADMEQARQLCDLLGGSMACTRPLVECGAYSAKMQIGLSGKTVKPKLIITLGISGSVQFASGMKSSDVIIAVNSDKNAPIFDIAHYGFVGEIGSILPELISLIKEERADV